MKKSAVLVIIINLLISLSCSSGNDNRMDYDPPTDLNENNEIVSDVLADDIAALSIIFGGSDTIDSVTQNITLPETGSDGIIITWYSDKSEIITNTGIVTRPEYGSGNAKVILTASLIKDSDVGTKDFTLTVIEIPLADEDAVSQDTAALSIIYQRGDNSNSVTQNLQLPITGSSGTIIIWESDDPGVISDTGTVTRPPLGSGDASATLTATISKGTYSETKEFSLIIKEMSPVYTITYKGNTADSGTVPKDTNEYEEGQPVTVMGNTGMLTKAGYIFAGWNTEPDGSGKSRTASSTFDMGQGNVALYAQWILNQYTVSFVANNGDTISPQYIYYHEKVTEPAEPSNFGYIFAGWYTEPEYTTQWIFDSDTVTDDMTLYAKWISYFIRTGTGAVAGDNQAFAQGSLVFNMKYVPGGLSFPTGTSDGGSASVDSPYWIAETEVTYELWSTVYIWATGDTDMSGYINGGENAGSYSLANAGAGSSDSGDVDQNPVSTINWRDAMVWTNALTEYYNAHNETAEDFDCVYYSDADYILPIRTSTNSTPVKTIAGSEDRPYIKASVTGNIDMANSTAKGFRLPTSSEWELAARYKWSNSANGAIEEPPASGYWWTPGDYASGSSDIYSNDAATDLVAWYDESENSESSHMVGEKQANTLGLYDMSGNIFEWNFDWHTYDPDDKTRVLRSGCWKYIATYLQVGYVAQSAPYTKFYVNGFRVTRSQ